MNTDSQERITALEVKITYLEAFLAKLQDIAVEQSNEIDVLKRESHMLRTKVSELIDAQEGDIPNVRPPHY